MSSHKCIFRFFQYRISNISTLIMFMTSLLSDHWRRRLSRPNHYLEYNGLFTRKRTTSTGHVTEYDHLYRDDEELPGTVNNTFAN